MTNYLRILSLCLTCLLTTGCESVLFYYQAFEGQLEILNARQPISALLENPSTPDTTKEKLRLVQAVRQFAEQQLLIQVDNHYSQYADLKRPYVVWNVFAAPEFSVTPTTWCYPIAGCVAYKGFFAEKDALSHAESLSHQGQDTYVGGIAAYSTLGWFEDPVLNTFLYRSDSALAGLLIHELAHQKLYVENDSAFNESFATAVEMIGLKQWLNHQNTPQEMAAVERQRNRKREFIHLVLSHREQLAKLYNQDIPKDEMRSQKKGLTDQLRRSYQALKEQWGGYSGYDRWFQGPLNNAQLSTIATYHHWVPSFMAIYNEKPGDWQHFYLRCQEIAQLNRDLRDKALEKLSVEAANYRL